MVLEVLELFGGEPGGTGSLCRNGVEGGDGLIEDIGEEPLAESGAQADGGIAGNALALIDGLPTEGSELV